jgi:hypothetical protein
VGRLKRRLGANADGTEKFAGATFLITAVEMVFIHPPKTDFREWPLRKGWQDYLVLNDDMFHAVRCAACASAMASSIVDAVGGGWQKSASAY